MWLIVFIMIMIVAISGTIFLVPLVEKISGSIGTKIHRFIFNKRYKSELLSTIETIKTRQQIGYCYDLNLQFPEDVRRVILDSILIITTNVFGRFEEI